MSADHMDIVRGRRSIRRYEEKEIADELLFRVLEAVQWAPSWANTQCWEIVVIRDQETKIELQKTVSDRNPSYKAIVAAPVLLAVCGKLKSSGFYKGEALTKFGEWFMFDLGIVTQNICLAAHALGLGTVIVGLFDHNRAKKKLSVPDGYELVALVPLGYPAHKSSTPKRKEIKDFTHYDTFAATDRSEN